MDYQWANSNAARMCRAAKTYRHDEQRCEYSDNYYDYLFT